MVLERLSIPRTAHANIMNICKPLVVKLKSRFCNCWDHSFSFWVFGPRMPQAKSPKPNMQETTTGWKDISLSFYESEKVFSWKIWKVFTDFPGIRRAVFEDRFFVLGAISWQQACEEIYSWHIVAPKMPCFHTTFDSSNSLLPRLCFLSLSCSFVLFCATFSCTHSFYRVVLPGGPCLAANLQHCHGSEGTNFVGLDFEILWDLGNITSQSANAKYTNLGSSSLGFQELSACVAIVCTCMHALGCLGAGRWSSDISCRAMRIRLIASPWLWRCSRNEHKKKDWH